MKRMMILFLLFFANSTVVHSCTGKEGNSPISAFDVKDDCSRICWLGINPNVTSSDDARTLLRGSYQVDQNSFHRTETGMELVWLKNITKTSRSPVDVTFENNLVKSINIGSLRPLTISDFIDLLGEPDEIIISLIETPDAGTQVAYSIYYRSRKTIIYVSTGDWKGPNPIDYVDGITLNTDFIGKDIQPWLGFGHLKYYLPGRELPTGQNPTPPGPL
jgi:hypothetical protein